MSDELARLKRVYKEKSPDNPILLKRRQVKNLLNDNNHDEGLLSNVGSFNGQLKGIFPFVHIGGGVNGNDYFAFNLDDMFCAEYSTANPNNNPGADDTQYIDFPELTMSLDLRAAIVRAICGANAIKPDSLHLEVYEIEPDELLYEQYLARIVATYLNGTVENNEFFPQNDAVSCHQIKVEIPRVKPNTFQLESNPVAVYDASLIFKAEEIGVVPIAKDVPIAWAHALAIRNSMDSETMKTILKQYNNDNASDFALFLLYSGYNPHEWFMDTIEKKYFRSLVLAKLETLDSDTGKKIYEFLDKNIKDFNFNNDHFWIGDMEDDVIEWMRDMLFDVGLSRIRMTDAVQVPNAIELRLLNPIYALALRLNPMDGAPFAFMLERPSASNRGAGKNGSGSDYRTAASNVFGGVRAVLTTSFQNGQGTLITTPGQPLEYCDRPRSCIMCSMEKDCRGAPKNPHLHFL